MTDFQFGSAFRPKVVEPLPEPKPVLDIDALAEALAVAIASVVLPAPQVHVEGPDISELVNAVVGIRGPATAEEIAAALAPLVRPPGQAPPVVDLSVLADLKAALEKLDFRMKGIGGPAFGASGPSNISDNADRLLGHVTVDSMPANNVGLTDSELRAAPVPVVDRNASGEVLAQQTGAGAVLTFTFASAVDLVVVECEGLATDVARADPFGGTPTATAGIPCRDEAQVYIPVTATVIKVFAPTASTVTVWGVRK